MKCKDCNKRVPPEKSAVCPLCGRTVCLDCYEKSGYRCNCEGEYKYFN